MAEQRKPIEYRFEIDAFTPESMPLSRLSQYLGDLARMMGQESSVHLARIENGSTVPVLTVDWEAQPKIQERLRAVRFNEGPAEARRAYKEINKRLIDDNANGVLIDPAENKIVFFPGRDSANHLEYGPIQQVASVQGIPIKIGGENDPVPVHLEDGDAKHIVSAPRRIAKQIAPFLFTSPVRIEGRGRWIRNKLGDWEMLSFHAQSFEVLSEGDLKSDLARLRALPGEWKDRDDPLADLSSIRVGSRPQ